MGCVCAGSFLYRLEFAGACTFGILTILYVNPYQYYTEAELYHVLRDRM